MNKCSHPESRGLDCDWEGCPKGLYESDWKHLIEEGCSYRRQAKWKPREESASS
jgi:hypothetical protein